MPGDGDISSERVAGRYQLLEMVGQGGMGVVWRGLDLDLEEQVAIKFLREELAQDEHLRACFRREVKLARRVTHPNVARVNEFGRDGSRYFLTMEFIDGVSLQSLEARQGRLSLQQAARMALGLCRGLAAAHAARVVHGDVKPANIMLPADRGAVVTDFGIAQALSEVQKTDGGAGTPLYMAPEQFHGSPMSGRTDVYAVGVVLLEALCGRLPWRTNDLVAVYHSKVSGQEPDLGYASDLPPAWFRLISDCLRTDPARRPEDARALLARLRDIPGFADVPVRAPRAGSAPLAAAEAPQWIEVALFNPENDPADASLDWVTGELIDALSQVHGLRVVASSPDAAEPVEGRTRVRGAVRAVGDELKVELELVDAHTHQTQATIELQRPPSRDLGAALAGRIVDVLRPETRVPRPVASAIEPNPVQLFFAAPGTGHMRQIDGALRRYDDALARAPGHPELHLGQTVLLLHTQAVARDPTEAELTDLRARAERALAELGNRGEPHWLMATVLYASNESLATAAYLRDALARAPTLTPALMLLSDMLLEIGRHPDAERRLGLVRERHGDSLNGIVAWAKLLTYQGRWQEFEALVGEHGGHFGGRMIRLLRWMLWHPDRAIFERRQAVLARGLDGLTGSLAEEARDVVAFARGDDAARRATFERMLAAHPGDKTARAARFYALLLVEMACIVGDLARAREQLRIVDRLSLIDWHWIEHCPLLAPLRGDPLFTIVRERVRVRADSVAEAIWDLPDGRSGGAVP